MPLIKLRKADENGDEVGVLYANTDQIVSINAGQSATEIHFADGRTQWVKETPDGVVATAKTAT